LDRTWLLIPSDWLPVDQVTELTRRAKYALFLFIGIRGRRNS
jgi:hypothetical protein